MTERLFEVPQGSFRLHHYPEPEPNRLAWNAADTLVLDWLAEAGPTHSARMVVVNDAHGALGVGLADHDVQSWSDSYLALSALIANLERNGVPVHRVRPVPSISVPAGDLEVAVVKIPKSLDRLADQLDRLRPRLATGALVVAAGMTKDIHNSTIRTFERILGPTHTSLARRKARLIHTELDPSLTPSGPTKRSGFRYGDSLRVVSWPGVFSSSRLDGGTEALLGALDGIDFGGPVVDMGCGNGVVGASVLLRHPEMTVHFTDESYAAVESARETVAASGIAPERATYSVDDCGGRLRPGTAGTVLVNPPFHGSAGRTSRVSSAMFDTAETVLRPGGQAIVVGNRHLGYHSRLQERFGNHSVLAATSKFSVIAATKAT